MLLLSACGLKTGLVVHDDTVPLPELVSLSHQETGEKLLLTLDIKGGNGEVFYQIDRAVIDPGCKYIADWLRYYESSPSQQRSGLQRTIKLRPDIAHAFRVRAADVMGHKSDWSPVIRTGVK